MKKRVKKGKVQFWHDRFLVIDNEKKLIWYSKTRIGTIYMVLCCARGVIVSSRFVHLSSRVFHDLYVDHKERATFPFASIEVSSCFVLSLPCLVFSCLVLALPCLLLPCLALPCLVFSCLALPCLLHCFCEPRVPVIAIPLHRLCETVMHGA